MALLDDRIGVTFGKDGVLYFNEPSVTQLNEHNNNMVKLQNKGKVQTRQYTASAKLFDELFDEAINLTVKNPEGKEVPLTSETKKFVPARRKHEIIQVAVFEIDGKVNQDQQEAEDPEDGEEAPGD